MVDVLGHLGMSLLWATPAWVLWGRRRAAAFLVPVLLASLSPDVDLYLAGVPHHGPTHTLLFVTAVAVVGGALLTGVVHLARRRQWWPGRRDWSMAPTETFAFLAAGLLVGGSSHVFTDMLSTSSTELPVNPFWPVIEKPFSVYLIQQFSAPLWNGGLLLLAVLIHAVLFAVSTASTDTVTRGYGK